MTEKIQLLKALGFSDSLLALVENSEPLSKEGNPIHEPKSSTKVESIDLHGDYTIQDLNFTINEITSQNGWLR